MHTLFFLDKYNIGALTVYIECMCFGMKRIERLAAKANFYSVSKHRHINSILTSIHQYCMYIFVFRQIVLSEQSVVMCIEIEILLLRCSVLYIPY